MTSLLLQPAGSQDARAHFHHTIDNAVSLDDPRVAQLLAPSDRQILATIYRDESIPLWGAVNGAAGDNIARWLKLAPGDRAVFTGGGRLFATGVVTHKFHNPRLALSLWGAADDGRPWELMYALSEIVAVDIPYEEFNRAVGYKPNYVPQGFNVLGAERTARALAIPALAVLETRRSVLAEKTLSAILGAQFDTLEVERIVQSRVEQGVLRRQLIPAATACCLLCGRDFPSEFVVAAHIKKRAACTDLEKVDLDHIAMVNCALGCDSLFESGLVAVDRTGAILGSHLLPEGPVADYFRKFLAGRTVENWAGRSGSHAYFDWHRSNTFRT